MKYDFFIRLEIANYIDDVLPIDTVVEMWNNAVAHNDSLAGIIPMKNFDMYVHDILKMPPSEIVKHVDSDRFFITDDYFLDDFDEEGCFTSLSKAEIPKATDSGLIADRIIDYRKNHPFLDWDDYKTLACEDEEFADFLNNVSWKYLGKEIER